MITAKRNGEADMVVHRQAFSSGNLLADLPATPGTDELIQVLASHAGNGVKIERIVSHGHATPLHEWYDQTRHEWVMVVQGEAIIAFDSERDDLHLRAGDYVDIPAHCRHRVAWTLPDTDTVWLAVFY
ncbi:cupin domain-containing protein [Pseudohongiella acticola]|nr:cupin domain-containing protein [Pseudohongiella acticola]